MSKLHTFTFFPVIIDVERYRFPSLAKVLRERNPPLHHSPARNFTKKGERPLNISSLSESQHSCDVHPRVRPRDQPRGAGAKPPWGSSRTGGGERSHSSSQNTQVALGALRAARIGTLTLAPPPRRRNRAAALP